MHRVDSLYYGSLGDGRRVYQAGPTGTKVGYHHLNSMQEEICGVIEATGEAVRLSGSADESTTPKYLSQLNIAIDTKISDVTDPIISDVSDNADDIIINTGLISVLDSDLDDLDEVVNHNNYNDQLTKASGNYTMSNEGNIRFTRMSDWVQVFLEETTFEVLSGGEPVVELKLKNTLQPVGFVPNTLNEILIPARVSGSGFRTSAMIQITQSYQFYIFYYDTTLHRYVNEFPAGIFTISDCNFMYKTANTD